MVDASQARQGSETGYISLLPYRALEGGTFESMIAVLAPWNAPLVSALIGKNDNGQPWLGLINETPQNWLRVTEPVPKDVLEGLHLRRLSVDCSLATGHDIFDALLPGANPPDIVAVLGDRKIGWELTSLTISKRRLATSLFFNVTGRLAAQHRYRIRHLSGYQIFMWFGDAEDAAGLPFRAQDGAAYDRLVDELVAYRPNPEQFRVSVDELREGLPGERFGPVRTAEDVRFFAIPLVGGVPDSGLFAATGISTGLAFQSDHGAPAEWDKLRKVIDHKDREGNDVLLISAGAPDRMGRCFMSEEILADFLLKNSEAVSTRHLSSVILHFWSTGAAFELLGDLPRELWKPLYQGHAPAHQPWRQTDENSL